jgi:aminoglycoside phosphotransferase (APT) family kinase protein
MDYHPHNVLVRDDGRAFVIDWPNAAISDYRLDLAWTLVLMGCHGNPDVAHHVLQAYEQSSGHAVEQLAFFEVAACLRRLISIVVSLRAGAEQLGMRPGAETMMKNVSHIENVYALLRDRAAVSIRDVDDLLSSLR